MIGFWWCLVPPRFREGEGSWNTGLPKSEGGGGGVQPSNDGGKLIVGVLGGTNTLSGAGLTATAFCGVWKDVGTGKAVAVVFRSGWVLEANMALLSLWADRSAFNAAAVVIATFGVTFSGRLDDDIANSSRVPTTPEISSLAIRRRS